LTQDPQKAFVGLTQGDKLVKDIVEKLGSISGDSRGGLPLKII
jgi:hypothetical protein